MQYRLTEHARLRMVERGISESVLEAILQNPDQIVPERDGTMAYQSKMNVAGRDVLIRLIVNDVAAPVIVVTVIKTTSIDRYWR